MRNAKFNGKTLSEFGFYLADSNFMDGAAKNVETIYVPGRSGLLQRFNNYENVKLWANVYCLSNMQQNMTALRTFLESCIGYQRYEDDFNPDEYRMASFKEMFTPGTVDVNGGVVRLVFDAMPQRFLKSGETATDATPSSTTSSGSTVSVPNPSGLSSVSDLKVDIEPVQDLNGQEHPYPGGGGKNLFDKDGEFLSPATTGTTVSATDTGVIVTSTSGGNNKYARYELPSNLLGKTITISADISPSSTNGVSIRVYMCTDTGDPAERIMGGGSEGSTSVTVKLPDTFPEGTSKIMLFLYAVTSGTTGTGLSVTYDKLQIEIGSEPTPYAPYSNICPISGHTQATVYRVGKNLLPNNWVTRTTNGVTFTPQPNGRVRVYGTATDYTTYSDSFVWTGDTGVYLFNGCPDGSATTYDTFIYDADAGQRARKSDGVTPCDSCYSGSQEVLLVKGTRYSYVIRVQSGFTMAQQLFAPMIRRPADDAYYDQYKGSEFTIDLNGTIYGGQVDFTTGEMTVDRIRFTVNDAINASSWANVTAYQNKFTAENGIMMFRISRTSPFHTSHDLKKSSTDSSCSHFQNGTWWNNVASVNRYGYTDGVVVCATYDKFGLSEWVSADLITAEQKKQVANAIGDCEFVWAINTPITVQLTPTQISLLQGSNYINASTGDVEITVSTPGMLLNPTLFESKPIIRMYGNGTVNLGNVTITVANSPFDFVDLDCETMDAHYGSGNANPYVSLSTDDFITLKPGENYVTYSGFTVVRITPRWYEI